jgi:hypothetical protein
MASLARWCFGHRDLVIVAWIVSLAVLRGLNGAAGTAYTNAFSLPGTDPTKPDSQPSEPQGRSRSSEGTTRRRPPHGEGVA